MIYVFYHMMSSTTPCPDGIFSAAVAKQVFGNNAKYIGCCYVSNGTRPPEADIPQCGDMVYVLDFSFEAWVLEEWQSKGIGFKIIDHHEKKMQELLGKRELADMIIFNNNKCGAILTWEFFNPNRSTPAILHYVDDRDRWQHKLPYTAEIHAAVGAIGRTFEFCDLLLGLSSDQLVAIFSKFGKREVEAKRKKVEELAKPWRYETIAGHKVPVIHLQKNEAWAASEVCQVLYLAMPDVSFTAAYYLDGDYYKWSLRSNAEGNNFNVAEVAETLGGGGHRNSAGYSTPKEWWDGN